MSDVPGKATHPGENLKRCREHSKLYSLLCGEPLRCSKLGFAVDAWRSPTFSRGVGDTRPKGVPFANRDVWLRGV